jgi:hypothetical protein
MSQAGGVIRGRRLLASASDHLPPMTFELAIEGLSHLHRPSASPIMRYFYARGMPNDPPTIEGGELSRDPAHEVPGPVPAGQHIGHRVVPCWTFCWTSDTRDADREGRGFNNDLNYNEIFRRRRRVLERAKGIEPSTFSLGSFSSCIVFNSLQSAWHSFGTDLHKGN